MATELKRWGYRAKNFSHRQIEKLVGKKRLIWIYPHEELLASRKSVEEGDTFLTFDGLDAIPTDLMGKFKDEIATNFDAVAAEHFSIGARLYVMTSFDDLVGILWTKRGEQIPRWFVDLENADVVIYDAYTVHKFRGRHVRSRLIPYAVDMEVKRGATRVYADCAASNKSSVRNIQKLGYILVKETKEYP